MFLRHLLNMPSTGEKAKVKIYIPNISRLMKNTLSLPDDWKFLSYDRDSYIYESKRALTENHFKIPMRGKTLSAFDFTRESVIIQPKIAAIRSLTNPWFSPIAGKKFIYRASIDYVKQMPETFRVIFKAKYGEVHDDDDDGSVHAIKVSNGENVISRIVTAPSKGRLLVKIIIKSKNGEVNFRDGPFYVWD